jgi:hypothetical protein
MNNKENVKIHCRPIYGTGEGIKIKGFSQKSTANFRR